jgi:putative transposase
VPFWRAYYHLVWSTAGRAPVLVPDVEARVFGAIVAAAGRLEATVLAVNGTSDHVHVIASVPPKVALALFVGQLKGSSSHVVNSADDHRFLAWGDGYGLFTVSPRQLDRAVDYVQRQKEHHAEGSTSPALEKIDA